MTDKSWINQPKSVCCFDIYPLFEAAGSSWSYDMLS